MLLLVNDGRHTIIGADVEKVLLELATGANAAIHDVAVDPAFLKLDRDFFAVGGGPVMHVDHDIAPLNFRF